MVREVGQTVTATAESATSSATDLEPYLALWRAAHGHSPEDSDAENLLTLVLAEISDEDLLATWLAHALSV